MSNNEHTPGEARTMSTEPTPGPWTWINSDWDVGRAGRLFGGGDLVTDQSSRDDFIYTSPANARLIAQAPTLKAENERLREALRFARSVIKSGEPWTDRCEEVIGSLLSKAETQE